MSVETTDTDDPPGPGERQRALDLDERRTELQFGVWARATVSEPQRDSLPPHMSRDIMNSLAGLNVDELGHLSRASRAAIIRIIPGASGGRIDGIRSVLPPVEDLPGCGGGSGQKRRVG